MERPSNPTRRRLLTRGAPLSAYDHLASLVLQVRPDREDEVRGQLAELPGLEIHASEGGKMVVTLEAPDEATIAEAMTAMNLLDGVYSATLVFHYHEPKPQGA